MPTWFLDKSKRIYRLGKQGSDAIASDMMVHLIKAACLYYANLQVSSFIFWHCIFVCYDKGIQNKLECFMMLCSNFFLPFNVLGF